MSNRTFERAVLDWLGDGSDRTPPPAIDAVLLAVKTTPQERELAIPRRFTTMTSSLRLMAAAIALVAVVGGGAIWFAAKTNPPPASTQSPIPSFTSAPTALPSPSPVSAPSPDVVLGWLTTTANPPSVYSWDGNRCRMTSCGVSPSGGFMHNCYGPCDVAITISLVSEKPDLAGATPATVAGYSGWYRRVLEPEPSLDILDTPVTEEWIVEINGATVVIRLAAKPDVSDAGLADAHAVIDSLYAEPSTRNQPGFRLVFTITNRDWDSG